MKSKRTFLVLGCLFLVYQTGMAITAIHAKRQARKLLIITDQLRLGTSTKKQVEEALTLAG
jgi:hypothetical protein